MSRVDCQFLDERLMDFLYEELEVREMDEMRAHVEGCPRCAAELGRFRGVRSAVSQLEMAEPPPAVSAKLLHQAAQVQRTSVWRRSRVMRMAVYSTPIVAMAAAFVLLIHVKEKALSPTIRPEDVSVTMEGRPAAPAANSETEGTTTLKPAEVSGAAAPTAEDGDKHAGKDEVRGGLVDAEKPRAGPAEDRKVEFKPPVTKETQLGRATHAPEEQLAHRGAATSAPTLPRSGDSFESPLGKLGNRRDFGAGGKAGGGAAPDPSKTVAKPKARELAKSEAAEAPKMNLQEPARSAAPTPMPTPAPPPADVGGFAQKKAQQQSYNAPPVTTTLPGRTVSGQDEAYKRYRNAPSQPAPQAQASQPTPELDETRAETQSMASQTRRQEQKQVTTPPEQLYSQLVTSSNNGNDCTKVMDLVKQLETWNFWGSQHPNEMRNAYQMRAVCQPDNNLANKDLENAKRISTEMENNQKVRASKAKKAAPAKSKAADESAPTKR